jgi:serine/threonine protein kinase
MFRRRLAPGRFARMGSFHLNEGRTSGDLSVVSELLSGSYDVRRDLGKSRTYLRFETETEGKRATVMLLPIDCAGRPDDAVAVDARLRELRTLDHLGTASVQRHGTRHGIPFVEHSPIAGRTLTEQLQQGPVGRERALTITLEVLEALAYAHSRGVTHGALTPEDIVLVRDSYEMERAVVYGIGLTSIVQQFGDGETTLSESDRYAAPEMLDGAPPSGRADIYSVGALLYRMITDEVPPAPPIVSAFAGNPILPPDLEPLLIRALAPDLVDRYPSVDEMIFEVEDALNARRALSSRPPLPRRHGSIIIARPKPLRAQWIAGGTLLALGIGVMAFAMNGPDGAPVPAIASTPPAEVPAAPSHVDVASETVDHLPAGLTEMPALDQSTAVEAEVDLRYGDNAVDPLAGALPPELDNAASRLLDGEALSRGELRPVYEYATEHPDDPRPSLMLGDAFVELGWYSDAIERYYSAFHADTASRHHAIMLENLIWLTFKERHVANFAADAIADIYGRDATDAVAAALASDPDGPDQRRRLERLYTRITH